MPFMSAEQASIGKFLPWVIGPISIVVTIGMPAAIQVYFAAAAGLQYLQTTALHIPFIRSMCGLPELKRNTDAPAVARSSPFPRAHAGTYQAPRTISTTATEEGRSDDSAAAEGKSPTSWNPMRMWSEAKTSMSESDWVKKSTMKQAHALAKKAEADRKAKELAQYRARVAKQQNRAGRK